MSGVYKVLMVLIGVALVLLLVFNGALLWQVGKLVDAGESEAKAKSERIEVHHEPTHITKPTEHTRESTTILVACDPPDAPKICEKAKPAPDKPASPTLPDTGGHK